MAITIIQGTVKFNGSKVFQGQYGNYRSAVFTLADGSEVKVFGDEADTTLANLRPGDPASLTFDGKKYHLAQSADSATSAPTAGKPATPAGSQPAAPATYSRKREASPAEFEFDTIVPMADKYCDLYRYVYERLRAGDPNDPLDTMTLPEEHLAAATATIIIQLFK